MAAFSSSLTTLCTPASTRIFLPQRRYRISSLLRLIIPALYCRKARLYLFIRDKGMLVAFRRQNLEFMPQLATSRRTGQKGAYYGKTKTAPNPANGACLTRSWIFSPPDCEHEAALSLLRPPPWKLAVESALKNPLAHLVPLYSRTSFARNHPLKPLPRLSRR